MRGSVLLLSLALSAGAFSSENCTVQEIEIISGKQDPIYWKKAPSSLQKMGIDISYNALISGSSFALAAVLGHLNTQQIKKTESFNGIEALTGLGLGSMVLRFGAIAYGYATLDAIKDILKVRYYDQE